MSTETLFRVDGLVALITGGGSGIGLMIAKALANNGASKVYIAGRRLEVLESAAASIGPNVIPLQCDVTSPEQLQQAASAIESQTGYLNLLVCNSGIGGPQVKPITPETTLEEWAAENLKHDYKSYCETLSVNAASVWYTSMTFLGLLDRGNKKGNLEQTSQIIVTSSIASLNKKAPGGWAYGQSKAAATHAAKQLAVALPQWDIRANCVAPGLFPSEMSAPLLEKMSEGETNNLPSEMIPLKRIGDEKEMMGTFLYLASRAGGYTNGAVIVIDGGRLGNFPSTF